MEWIKVSKQRPSDNSTHAARKDLGNKEYEYTSITAEGQLIFVGDKDSAFKQSDSVLNDLEWLKED